MAKLIRKLMIGLVIIAALAGTGFLLFQNRTALGVGPGIAHATLHSDLTPPGGADTHWLFNATTTGKGNATSVGVWSILLGLANAFVAIVLFFFAFVNIAHIQYDTYQLKKVMPNLLIGIVLANFSMLIARLMVDVGSVLTVTFVQNAQGLGNDLMCAMFMGADGNFAQILFGGSIGLIVIVLVTLIIMIGIVLLSLLLWVRRMVIYLLAATAPIAFIMMAFPPTESYFKKWWEWEIKYVFMGPIMIFLIWVASKIGASNCTSGFSLTVLFASLGLVYLAAIVPFLLGGKAMDMAGNLGKGIGKATANNPFVKRKLDRASTALQNRFSNTGLGKMMDAGRDADERAIENNKGLREANYQRQQKKGLEKNKDKQKNIDAAIKDAKTDMENVRLEMELEIKQGNLGKISNGLLRRLHGIKGKKTQGASQEEVRKRFLDQRQKTNDLKNGMEKEESETLLLQAGIVAEKNEALKEGTKQMGAGGKKVHARVNQNGDALVVGAPDEEIDYTDAMNQITNFEFMAKSHAGTPEGEKYHRAAEHLREQTATYREQNQTYDPGVTINGRSVANQKIDYEAFKDKNLAGRQMKTMGVGIADEVKTLQQTASHTELVNTTNDPTKAFTNGRFQATSTEHDDMLTGNIADVGINQRIVSTEYTRAQFENAKGAGHGDRKGIESQQMMLDRVQAAHTRKGTGIKFKQEKRHAAVTKLAVPAQEHVKAQIMMQAAPPGTYPDTPGGRAAAIAAYDAGGPSRDTALDSFDATKIDTTSSQNTASYARSFLEGVNTEIETDNTLKLATNPGIPIREARA